MALLSTGPSLVELFQEHEKNDGMNSAAIKMHVWAALRRRGRTPIWGMATARTWLAQGEASGLAAWQLAGLCDRLPAFASMGNNTEN